MNNRTAELDRFSLQRTRRSTAKLNIRQAERPHFAGDATGECPKPRPAKNNHKPQFSRYEKNSVACFFKLRK